MNKSTQASAAPKIFSILGFCGVIIFAFSSCKKNESEQTVPDKAVQTSDTTVSAWSSIFPDGLMDADGVEVPLDRLKGKMVGLYFSASWCIPCHSFTPHLVEFQNQHHENFEVVLVGRDYAEENQLEYMKKYDMTFPSTQWANGKNTQANKLIDKHKVKGIPRLVILSPEGQVVIENARNAIDSSPEDITELFTNKQKRDELAATHAEAAQNELNSKTQAYNKALQEHFPPHDKDHKTTRVAQYSFDSTAEDSLEKSPAFALKNTTYDDAALSLNGIFANKDNGYEASVFLEDLDYTQFSIGLEFLIRDYPSKGSRKSTAIVVGGKFYRWFVLKCDPQGEMELFLNNGRFAHGLSNAKVGLNEWNRVLVSVDLYQGIARAWFNGEILPAVELPKDFMLDVIPSAAVKRDANFNFTNFSNSETLDGLVDDVVVFDGALSEAEMAKEAASIGNRWTDE